MQPLPQLQTHSCSSTRPLTDLALPHLVKGTTSYLVAILVNLAFLWPLFPHPQHSCGCQFPAGLPTSHCLSHPLALASHLNHWNSPLTGGLVFKPFPFGPWAAHPSSGSSLIPLRQSSSSLMWFSTIWSWSTRQLHALPHTSYICSPSTQDIVLFPDSLLAA